MILGAKMSRTTSVIPEELEAIISSLKEFKPTWTFYKTEKGYGVKIFWKNNRNGSDTSFNITHSSRRHLCGKQRMEEFLQKKSKEGKHTVHTYSQETIKSPFEPKLNPPAPAAQRCEIRNSIPNAASQQQFADPVEWKNPTVPNRRQPWKQWVMWKVEAWSGMLMETCTKALNLSLSYQLTWQWTNLNSLLHGVVSSGYHS